MALRETRLSSQLDVHLDVTRQQASCAADAHVGSLHIYGICELKADT